MRRPDPPLPFPSHGEALMAFQQQYDRAHYDPSAPVLDIMIKPQSAAEQQVGVII